MSNEMFILLLVIALAVIICIGITIWDTNRFVLREYHFKSGKVKKEFRFMILSDLHNKSYGKNNEKLLKAIEKCNPDAVLCAGDMLTAKPGYDFQNALDLLTGIAKNYPVYYGNGNHEHRLRLYPKKYPDMHSRFSEALQKAGIERLLNIHTVLPDFNITIYGLEISTKYYKKFAGRDMPDSYLPEVLGSLPKESYNIMIAHNPEYFPAYAGYGADLVVAGHMHGGVARLPVLGGVISPSFRLFPKYDGGLFREKESDMVLSRGLGTHTIPIRFLNPGELITVIITPQ